MPAGVGCGAKGRLQFRLKTFGAVLEARKRRPFLEKLTETTDKYMAGESLELKKLLEGAGPADRLTILSDLVRTMAAQVLGFDRPEFLDQIRVFSVWAWIQ